LFGAVFITTRGTLSVTADQTESIEGHYVLTSVNSVEAQVADRLNLYVESPPNKTNTPAALSGSWAPAISPIGFGGILGRLSGSSVSLTLLANQLSGDTLDVFVGEVEDNKLVGAYVRRGGPVVFTKQ
jgi:hypothetical protein